MDRAFAAPAPAGTWRVGVRLSIGEAAVAALCVATLCGALVAELRAPQDVTVGSVSLVPVVVAAYWLRPRRATPIVGLALASRILPAVLRDIPGTLALLEMASLLAAATVARLARWRVTGDRPPGDGGNPPGAALPRPMDRALGSAEPSLTLRERQVVELAMWGLTASQIGERLFIGRRTVETHLARAYPKLGVGSKRDLVAAALDRSISTACPVLVDGSAPTFAPDREQQNDPLDAAIRLNPGRRLGHWATRHLLANIMLALAGPIACTWILVDTPQARRYLFVYLGLVALLGTVGGRIPAVVTAVASCVLIDWYFVPPPKSLLVHESGGDMVRMATFLSVALLIGWLVSRARSRPASIDT